ncbi:hypothetical protein CCORG_0690 [Campylobacter corcagiensis]|nr:hypothetical protein CCORG_0690 [Campylobacter corcagiensis]
MVGLIGNYKVFPNSLILTKSSSKSAKITKKATPSATKKEKITKISTLCKAFYHDLAIWAYVVKKDANSKDFTSLKRELDFEMITSDKVLRLRLRNADIKATTLENIETTSSGLTITGTKASDIYKPNQWREISIIASSVGDIDAGGLINFIFTKQVITIYIKGTRAVVFSYKPAYSYSESKVYQTSIFTAQNSKEVRTSLSKSYKKKVSFNVITKELNSGVEQILSFALQRYCLVPLWNSLSISKTSGTLNILRCDTTLKEFDKYLIVWRAFNDFEFAKILNLDDDKITIDKQISINSGDYIVPLLKTTPAKSINYDFLTSEVKSYKLEFLELK